MAPEQIALVRASFAKVVPIKETAADLFYTRLFELDPSLKPLVEGDIKEQDDTVASTPLWALEQGLGAAFTPDVKSAWTSAYGVLAGTMKEAAAA